MNDDGFCLAPWGNLHVHPTGTVRPCCISTLELADLNTGQTLRDAWTSEAARGLRREFLAGKRPASCSSCYDREAAGVTSVRQQLNERFNDRSLDQGGDNPPLENLRQLDLSFTNECNLTCKICGPQCSSKWINLAKSLPVSSNHPLWSWYKREDRQAFEMPADNLLKQLEHFPDVTDFEIKGGEPFISKEHDEFLRRLAERPDADKFVFRYVTNGTYISATTLEILSRFREMHLWVSVDGTGDLYKYIRGGKITLSRVEKTIRDLYKVPRSRVGVVFTLSIFNIFGIADFWAWYQQLLLELPELQIYPGVVSRPMHLNSGYFPPELRQRAWARIPTGDHPFLNSMRDALGPGCQRPAPPDLLANFREYTRTLENALGESLARIQPEFVPLLESPEP